MRMPFGIRSRTISIEQIDLISVARWDPRFPLFGMELPGLYKQQKWRSFGKLAMVKRETVG